MLSSTRWRRGWSLRRATGAGRAQPSHLAGKRAPDDPLTDVAALGHRFRNWRAMLRHGLAAGDLGPEGEAVAEAVESRLRTGRPLAAAGWIAAQEENLAPPLAPQRPGRKAKGQAR